MFYGVHFGSDGDEEDQPKIKVNNSIKCEKHEAGQYRHLDDRTEIYCKHCGSYMTRNMYPNL